MYTSCTGCLRQFRIHAEQLSAAGGLVKCGYCGEQFNALEYLSDEPRNQDNLEQENNVDNALDIVVPGLQTIEEHELQEDGKDERIDPENEEQDHIEKVYNLPAEAIVEQIEQEEDETAEQEDNKEPQFDLDEEFSTELPLEIPDQNPGELAAEDVVDLVPDDELVESEQGGTGFNINIDGLDSIDESVPSLDIEQYEEQETQAEELLNNDVLNKHFFGDETGEAIPEELLSEEPQKAGRISFYLWGLGSVLLVLILGLLLSWFHRDHVYSRYPQVLPYVKKFCAEIQCSVYGDEDFSKIELVSRDVRIHPRFSDSLLVNAVMANRSGKKISYPKIQLSLYDTDGRMVSYRRFKVNEYLSNSVDRESGMQPDTPIHFVLELSGHLESAVSFEFDFF